MTRVALSSALVCACAAADADAPASGSEDEGTTAASESESSTPTTGAPPLDATTSSQDDGAHDPSSEGSSGGGGSSSTGDAGDVLFDEDFENGLDRWLPELEAPATSAVAIVDGELDIAVSAGATIWFTERITGDVVIEYDVTMVAEGGPYDRVSDLNKFWMATQTDDAAPFGRDGTAEDYFDLRLYYVGMGGYDNTRTRFRRYEGPGGRPILGEYDDAAHLLTANATYAIRIVVDAGTVEFHVDDELFFTHDDPYPYASGWFALRTLESHLRIDRFRVTRL